MLEREKVNMSQIKVTYYFRTRISTDLVLWFNGVRLKQKVAIHQLSQADCWCRRKNVDSVSGKSSWRGLQPNWKTNLTLDSRLKLR